MVPVTLADLVTRTSARPAAGSRSCATCVPASDNLAARMVRELEARLERRFEVRVEIAEAHARTAAGLGGGSSDAAATLVALERLFALDLSPRLRYEIAAAVGSDVPFFLWPGPQLAMGRGKVLREVELPEPLHFVIAAARALALHGRGVRLAGRGRRARRSGRSCERAQALSSRAPGDRHGADVAALVDNDLQATSSARQPEVRRAPRAPRWNTGALAAAMSGSGSAVFGLFADATRRAARAAARPGARGLRRLARPPICSRAAVRRPRRG